MSRTDMRRDPLRAAFLILAVMAQLLLPPVIARAQASDICAAGRGTAGTERTLPGADHTNTCAHCVAPMPTGMGGLAPRLAPPRSLLANAACACRDQGGDGFRAGDLPPATGPPSSIAGT